MTLKKFPLGDQGFAEIIGQKLLYADKTKYIHALIESQEKNFFLSRPRRFGKTLLLDTIMELFSGERDRFKGLWVDSSPESKYAFPRHPVISLSLSLEADDPRILKEHIVSKLEIIAEEANLLVKGTSPGQYLGNLVRALKEDSKANVVILIDEYDAPVTRNMRDQGPAKPTPGFFTISSRL
jgi:hypothetical protein